MKYIFNYLLLPILKLGVAITLSSLVLGCVISYWVIYSLWTLKLKSPFRDSFDYHDNVFEWISTEREYSSEYSTHYKSAFHWALNIGATQIPNPRCIVDTKEKETFKEFVNSESK